MKITINKTAKRVLSVTLALAMILGTLFVANVGVTFDASAASVEDTWDGTKVEPTATDAQGNIIINTAEELAWIALQGGSATSGKNYKVADGIKYFNMNGSTGVTVDSTVSNVKSATATTNLWNHSADFAGNFDGNGVVVYNIRNATGVAYGGLFPRINGVNSSIKNVTVKASIIYAYHGAGAILGQGSGQFTTTIDNCAVENCYMTDNNNTNTGCQRSAGIFVGSSANHCIKINNCFAAGNECSGVHSYGGFVGRASAWAPGNFTFTNCVSLGISPYTTAGDGAIGDDIAVKATWTSVYTDTDLPSGASTNAVNGIKKLTTAQMTGEAATQNMALDFSGVWFANTSGAPELRMFHNVTAKNNGDTHSEVCADCGLVGLTVEHYYNDVNYDSNTTSCVCGQFIFGTHDVWDGTKASGFAGGTGTEADPYIIKTAEQLFLMVRSTGLDANGNPIYYKVADSVNALYINDTRGFADQAAFEAAAGTLKNWSDGLMSEKEYCAAQCSANGTTCAVTKHLDACINFFAGKFDGNGVTIYGLYSYSDKYSYYAPGVGFVPALTDDAIIKNVIFDTSYIKTASNNGGYAGVVTSCLGSYYDGQYNQGKCENVISYARTAADDCRASVINVAVRNAFVETKDCPLTSGTQSYAAGLVSSTFYPKSFNISNCLFDGTNSTFKLNGNVSLTNEAAILSTRSSTHYATVTGCLNILGTNAPQQVMTHSEHTDGTICEHNSYSLSATDATVESAPLLNWTAFDNDEATLDKYGTPMPNVTSSWNADDYLLDTGVHLSKHKQMALTGDVKYNGYDWGALRGSSGIFNNYDSLIGGGTEADPYIISDAITLYRIIASGGTHFGVPQYFKLDRNIDLEGLQWIDTELMRNEEHNVTFYDYQPFEGTLDGDGYTISNMYCVKENAEDAVAGFVPQLAETGVIKNINFNNCYAYDDSDDGGIIAGFAADESTIENCSLNYCLNEKYVGYSYQETWKDCYIVKQDGSVEYSESTPELDGVNWYGISAENATTPIRSTTFAKKMPCADIDADGLGEEYTTRDVTVLKNNLLWKSGYDYIYGDVSGNGKTDMRDLAALQRIMTGGDTVEIDGFWPNVKAGKFSIWYDEDDNYDFARKFELYLEGMSGLDIVKTKGSSNSNYTVSIVTDTSMGAGNYSSAYDTANAKLVIKGGSFTAVEEAVDRVIAETDAFGLPAQFTGTINTIKNPIEVKIHSTSNDNGSLTNSSSQVSKGTYYYVWGDEFNTDGNISYDRWHVRDLGSEGTNFKNLKLANNSDLLKLNTISNGKLTMNRGVGDLSPAVGPSNSIDNDGNILQFDSNDMSSSGVLTSVDSMLFKRGYMELKATLPNDANAFPAWWLLTNPSGRGNSVIANSLYSKVFELNKDYDGSFNYSADNYKSYQYKLPTNYFEIDIFEIINNPNSGSKRNAIWYNIHKWYSNCFTSQDSNKNFKVYDLAWDKLEAGTISDFDDQDPLLVMTYNSSTAKYTASDAKISYHVTNSTSGQINAAINQFGGSKYGGFNGEEPSWWDQLFNGAVQQIYDVNMGTIIDSSNVVTEYIYGFLWTEEEMSYIIKDVNGNLLVSVTVDCDDLGYDNGPTLLEQYAYFLIDNHFYTKDGATVSYNGQMIIDYVRLYQLDGARDIITPESESIYNR